MSNDQELVKSNIELSAEFSRYVFEHPEIEESIPADAEVILLPEYDKDLKAFNLALGRRIEEGGGRVTYISVGRLRPRQLSRIENLQVA